MADAIRKDHRLIDEWARIGGHDVRMNPEFLEDFSRLDESRKLAMLDLTAKLGAPANFRGRVNYTATREVNGKVLAVDYDEFGFPDFRRYSPGESYVYSSNNLVGEPTDIDIKATRNYLVAKHPKTVKKKGLTQLEILDEESGEWVVHTMHHHQDGRSMIPVVTEVHNKFSHSGGAAVIKAAENGGLKGFFDDLVF